MKVIMIYGPPGVGKMTTAKELSKISNYKCLPHGLILDLIMPIISKKIKDSTLWDLYEEIKISIVSSAKKKGKDIILTEVYDNPTSNNRLKEFIKKLDKLKIKHYFLILILLPSLSLLDL